MSSLSVLRKFVVAMALAVAPAASFAGVFISVSIAPPAFPVYTQPLCPGEGYLWTPGYWAWGPAGYYWVPGTWVQPPMVGVLWTPGYWGWGGSAFIFHEGYWGPHVGFYGGINYGFGYGGRGYEGGYWNGGRFAYNTAVNNVNVTNIHNTYVKNVTVNNTVINNHVSYNGGTGGVAATAQAQELAAQRERHAQATVLQQTHQQAAAQDRGQLASVNGGRPQLVAARTPNEYKTVAQQHAAVQPITIADRKVAQQQRIGNGVSSGQLTPRETGNLQNREASINHQTAADRTANGGKLTPQERQQINQRQNNVSNSIYNDKHNGAVDRPVVNNQQPRPQAQPRPQPQAQAQPRPQVQAQPRPQPQARPQPRPQAEPRPQAAPREEPRGGGEGHHGR